MIANGAPPRALLPVVCDVAKDSEARSLMGLAQRAFGEAPMILVNCAGVSKPNASLMDGDSAAWVEMLSTNVLAAAMCGREACRAMEASGRWGHIITVSSLSGVPHRCVTPCTFWCATSHSHPFPACADLRGTSGERTSDCSVMQSLQLGVARDGHPH